MRIYNLSSNALAAALVKATTNRYVVTDYYEIVAGIGTCGCLFVTNYELFRIMRERAASVGDNIRSVSFLSRV